MSALPGCSRIKSVIGKENSFDNREVRCLCHMRSFLDAVKISSGKDGSPPPLEKKVARTPMKLGVLSVWSCYRCVSRPYFQSLYLGLENWKIGSRIQAWFSSRNGLQMKLGVKIVLFLKSVAVVGPIILNFFSNRLILWAFDVEFYQLFRLMPAILLKCCRQKRGDFAMAPFADVWSLEGVQPLTELLHCTYCTCLRPMKAVNDNAGNESCAWRRVLPTVTVAIASSPRRSFL